MSLRKLYIEYLMIWTINIAKTATMMIETGFMSVCQFIELPVDI